MTRSALLLAALLILGCGDGAKPVRDGAPTPVDAGAGLDAAPDSSRAAQDAVDAAALVPIWRPDSRRLEVWCSLGFGSISRFEADRDQLTEAQLGALASLRARLSGIDSVCYLDGASCVVDILSAGDRVTVRGPLEWDCDESYRVITRASFQPLFNLLDCHAVSRSRDGP